jgi:hypothetical protein
LALTLLPEFLTDLLLPFTCKFLLSALLRLVVLALLFELEGRDFAEVEDPALVLDDGRLVDAFDLL